LAGVPGNAAQFAQFCRIAALQIQCQFPGQELVYLPGRQPAF